MTGIEKLAAVEKDDLVDILGTTGAGVVGYDLGRHLIDKPKFNISKVFKGQSALSRIKPTAGSLIGALVLSGGTHQAIKAMQKNKWIKKTAGEVKIPEGGLRPGFLINDLTQLMTLEDSKKVKEKKGVFSRSGPGIGIMGLVGAATGSAIGGMHGSRLKGALIGGALMPSLLYGLTRSGKYDMQALKAAEKLVEEVSDK